MATYRCLYDFGNKCSSNNDYANLFLCFNGMCTCTAPHFTYVKQINSCVNSETRIGSACRQDSDCKSSMLSCDLMKTCRAGLNQYFAKYSDCINNLKCGYIPACGCVIISND